MASEKEPKRITEIQGEPTTDEVARMIRQDGMANAAKAMDILPGQLDSLRKKCGIETAVGIYSLKQVDLVAGVPVALRAPSSTATPSDKLRDFIYQSSSPFYTKLRGETVSLL